MKKAYSLRGQLMVVCIGLVTVPVLALGFISILTSMNVMDKFVGAHLQEQSLMITNDIKTAIELNQRKVSSNLKVAHEIFYEQGNPVVSPDEMLEMDAVDQFTLESKKVRIPAMMIDNKKIAFSYDIVDRVQQLTGGTVTIFQMIPDGALRISTNVLNADGKRALGTYIPSTSPVYKAVSQGSPYYGRAFVVNQWRQTAYEPIKDGLGNVIGMLYAGSEDASMPILEALSKRLIGKTGYVSIIDENGAYVLSRNRERDGTHALELKDAKGNLFMQDIAGTGRALEPGKTGVMRYQWKSSGEGKNHTMVAGIAFFPEWKWIVVSQADVEDYYDAILAMKIQTVFIAAMAILAGIFIAYFFGLSVSRPVHKLLGALKCVAEGDFTQAPGIKSRIREMNSMSEQVDIMIENLSGTVHLAEKVAQGDLTVQVNQLSERDALGHALKTMVGKLSGMLSEIAMSAGNVSAGAEQMNATSQAMSQGATEQAGSLEEITSSMNEITSQVRQNAEHAAQANRLADEARASAEQGNGQVSEMVASMKGISESSRNISRIIKVIDEIAFQTNLLALNAAVEAARAGRYGKGFAVVAEEVRSLAARSAKAAKETSEMIEEAVRKIESGTSMADRTADALQEIVHAARKVTGLVGEIAAASREQSHGVAQISQGLAQIDQVTQQNTAHAEESASAAEELASQSMILQQYVSMFKVTEAQMRRPRQADTAERATSRMLEPVLHQSRIIKNVAAAGSGPGNGNGNGKTAWGGLRQTDAVPPPVIQLDDQDFGKY